MSNEVGKGWVEVTLAQPRRSTAFVGRDRNGQFSDRTPTNYRIEAKDASGHWITVADSSDRYSPEDFEKRKSLTTSFAGLPPAESKRAQELASTKKQLESQACLIARSQIRIRWQVPETDEIHLLHRGVPEKPKQIVAPVAPTCSAA